MSLSLIALIAGGLSSCSSGVTGIFKGDQEEEEDHQDGHHLNIADASGDRDRISINSR